MSTFGGQAEWLKLISLVKRRNDVPATMEGQIDKKLYQKDAYGREKEKEKEKQRQILPVVQPSRRKQQKSTAIGRPTMLPCT